MLKQKTSKIYLIIYNIQKIKILICTVFSCQESPGVVKILIIEQNLVFQDLNDKICT